MGDRHPTRTGQTAGEQATAPQTAQRAARRLFTEFTEIARDEARHARTFRQAPNNLDRWPPGAEPLRPGGG